jgi:6-pyruvoyltetrahydropterin/6-carboxytetrahydropterin synthase
MGKYQSTKIFDNYSVAIRQWKAQHSHCQLLHGYALKFKVWFESVEPLEKNQLDEMNWIQDYGGFKSIDAQPTPGNGLKDWMDYMWDHTLLIEKDDPYLDLFESMNPTVCHLRVMDKIGAESAAKLVYDKFNDVFSKTGGGRVKVTKVECWEADKNSSIYQEDIKSMSKTDMETYLNEYRSNSKYEF